MHDVIILGSGPAGLTAGIYTIRAGYKTLLIAGIRWGGQLMLTTLVENYPGFAEGIQGPDLMMAMRKQAERLGVEIVNADFEEGDFSSYPFKITADNKMYEGKSVVITTGADSIWLNVPGEIQLRGKGVSTCATCDAFFFRGKNVFVVGGGDSAMEDALVLAKVCKEVTIIHRRDKFRASFAMVERVKKEPNVKIMWNTILAKYNGTDHVESVVLRDVKTNEERTVAIDGVFVAIGHKPNTEKFKGIELNQRGYIVRREVTDEQGLIKFKSATSVPGVFVAGDVHDYRYKQAITAAGFGCIAALDADRWLSENQSLV
ncbi:thioredoxin-disulfide reductase [Candidatus Gottesmanbacteria bacterium]|nr:thioredoxin-disulfide reductase [Candidatus Gottesmanbacteria bacterium]